MAKKPEAKETMVAECELMSPEGKERIKSFNAAWHKLLLLPTPATSTFIGFVRKDA